MQGLWCLRSARASHRSVWFSATNSLTSDLHQTSSSPIISTLSPSSQLDQPAPSRQRVHQSNLQSQQLSTRSSSPASLLSQSRSTGLSGIVQQQSFALHQHTRGMAIVVDVVDSNVEQALKILQRKAKDAGIQAELRKRTYFMNGEQQRHKHDQELWNRAMGKKIEERIKWVTKRRLIKM